MMPKFDSLLADGIGNHGRFGAPRIAVIGRCGIGLHLLGIGLVGRGKHGSRKRGAASGGRGRDN